MLEKQIDHKKTQAEEMARQQLEVYLGLLEMAKDPMAQQNALLYGLLESNKDTAYGQKCDFAAIHDLAAFRKNVPLSDYSTYEPYIDRMIAGERNLITVDEVHTYNKSSGTVGKPKKIPITDKGRQVFMKYAAMYEYGIRLAKGVIPRGKGISLVQASPVIPVLPDGSQYGALSEITLTEGKAFLPLVNTSPLEAQFAEPHTGIRYLHARYGLMERNASFISFTFSSFAMELLRYIERYWELLVRDIERGTIDPKIKLPQDVREKLSSELTPDPERAAELRAIFSQGFDTPFVPKVWPNMTLISGATTGSFRNYTDQMRERYIGDGISWFHRGVSSSEGALTQPLDFNTFDSMLLPESVFFEFLPMVEGVGDENDPRTLDQLEIGKEYEVVITNRCGFYRYRMSDVFLITGMYEKTPLIQFQYRANKTVDVMGEKTTEHALLAAAAAAAEKVGYELVNSTMYPDYDHAGYVFLEEIDHIPAGTTEEQIRQAIEDALAEANPSMGAKIRSGICAPTVVKFVEPKTALRCRDIAVAKRGSPSQQKPITVITKESQKQFFLSRVITFEELMKIAGEEV